jgi:hypothetical protein
MESSSLQAKVVAAFNSMPAVENSNELSCVCGQRYPNNCAHFLSNYLINAGISELKNYPGFQVCASGRPIRAFEVEKWASRNAIVESSFPTSGVVYIAY